MHTLYSASVLLKSEQASLFLLLFRCTAADTSLGGQFLFSSRVCFLSLVFNFVIRKIHILYIEEVRREYNVLSDMLSKARGKPGNLRES